MFFLFFLIPRLPFKKMTSKASSIVFARAVFSVIIWLWGHAEIEKKKACRLNLETLE